VVLIDWPPWIANQTPCWYYHSSTHAALGSCPHPFSFCLPVTTREDQACPNTTCYPSTNHCWGPHSIPHSLWPHTRWGLPVLPHQYRKTILTTWPASSINSLHLAGLLQPQMNHPEPLPSLSMPEPAPGDPASQRISDAREPQSPPPDIPHLGSPPDLVHDQTPCLCSHRSSPLESHATRLLQDKSKWIARDHTSSPCCPPELPQAPYPHPLPPGLPWPSIVPSRNPKYWERRPDLQKSWVLLM